MKERRFYYRMVYRRNDGVYRNLWFNARDMASAWAFCIRMKKEKNIEQFTLIHDQSHPHIEYR